MRALSTRISFPLFHIFNNHLVSFALFFTSFQQIKFKIDDIVIPEVETMFSSMFIGPKKKPVFVDAASFTDTHHYARFMGYDKPLDFRLDANANENEQPTKLASATNASQKPKSIQSSNK